MIFNISEGFKNSYQMLMKRRPKAECNTTVAEMGCRYTDNIIPDTKGFSVADYLMDILDSKRGRDYLQSIVPGARYNPWNDSYCISWAVNIATESATCKVKKVSLDKMVAHLSNRGAVGIGGGFLNGKTYGHFVCVVGFVKDINGNTTHIIIDDPYGNMYNSYKDHYDGNDIRIPIKTFIKLTFGRSKKKTMQFYYKFGGS